MYKKTEKNYFLVMGLYVILFFVCVFSSIFKLCIIKGKIKIEKERTLSA